MLTLFSAFVRRLRVCRVRALELGHTHAHSVCETKRYDDQHLPTNIWDLPHVMQSHETSDSQNVKKEFGKPKCAHRPNVASARARRQAPTVLEPPEKRQRIIGVLA